MNRSLPLPFWPVAPIVSLPQYGDGGILVIVCCPVQVGGVRHRLDVPAEGFEAHPHVLGEGDVRAPIDGDVVVVHRTDRHGWLVELSVDQLKLKAILRRRL